MRETPAFNIATIYVNAFTAISQLSITKLKKHDIVIFCNLLTEELISSYGCKYVYFQFDKQSFKTFYQAYFGIFTEIGDDIYLNQQTELENLSQLNSIYNDEIQHVIGNVRLAFLLQQADKLNFDKLEKKEIVKSKSSLLK